MRLGVLIFLIICFKSSFGQQAMFYADLNSHPLYKLHKKEITEKYSDESWIINGVSLNYGDTIMINVDPNKIDTILFRHHQSSGYDEILTNIKNPYTYKFTVNICCQTFNTLLMHDSVQISNNVSFQLTNETQSRILCLLDENGKYLIDTSAQIVKSICGSAMSSEVNEIKVLKVKECSETAKCIEIPCLTKQNQMLPEIYDSKFEAVSTLIKFMYLSLDLSELSILINPINGNVKLK